MPSGVPQVFVYIPLAECWQAWRGSPGRQPQAHSANAQVQIMGDIVEMAASQTCHG